MDSNNSRWGRIGEWARSARGQIAQRFSGRSRWADACDRFILSTIGVCHRELADLVRRVLLATGKRAMQRFGANCTTVSVPRQGLAASAGIVVAAVVASIVGLRASLPVDADAAVLRAMGLGEFAPRCDGQASNAKTTGAAADSP